MRARLRDADGGGASWPGLQVSIAGKISREGKLILALSAQYVTLLSMKKSFLWLALFSLLTCSCAYFQTHKNIRAGGTKYSGCQLKQEEISLVQHGSQWYIKAPALTLQKQYPAIHDSVLLTDNNAPTYTPCEEPTGHFYLPISTGTATTLTLADGYANIHDLAGEITRLQSDSPFARALPSSRTHRITAQLDGSGTPTIINYSAKPQEVSWTRNLLSKVDFVLIDVPGTVLYNVAIPVMAPIIFFKDFLNEED